MLPRGISSGRPLYQLVLEQKAGTVFQEFEWTPELEEYLLLEYPTRMADPEEESERLANVLLNNLKAAELAFGEDFAQSVFVELLGEEGDYGLDELLKRCATNRPSRDSQIYSRCRDFLRSAITGLQNTVILNLRYSSGAPTRALMSNALKIVLDERFHLSVRDRLFGR